MDDCPVNQEPYILGLIKYLPDVALVSFKTFIHYPTSHYLNECKISVIPVIDHLLRVSAVCLCTEGWGVWIRGTSEGVVKGFSTNDGHTCATHMKIN